MSIERTGKGRKKRDEVFTRVAPAAVVSSPDRFANVWQRLLILHAPFRSAEREEYESLVRALDRIDDVFLEHELLGAYYEQLWPETTRIPERESMSAEERFVNALRAVRVENLVIDLQVRLMQDAFYSLKLNAHGNAPDNRGWMNLFRRWGRSATFNTRFDEITSTLTMTFVAFYRDYLRNCPLPIEDAPIPHPWDQPIRRRHPVTKVPLNGIYLDSGIHEVRRKPDGTWSGGDPATPPESGAHGVDDVDGLGFETPPTEKP